MQKRKERNKNRSRSDVVVPGLEIHYRRQRVGCSLNGIIVSILILTGNCGDLSYLPKYKTITSMYFYTPRLKMV